MDHVILFLLTMVAATKKQFQWQTKSSSYIWAQLASLQKFIISFKVYSLWDHGISGLTRKSALDRSKARRGATPLHIVP